MVIGLFGSPFSVRYAAERTRGPARALDFCALNIALYAHGASAWSLEERRVADDDRTAGGARFGASAIGWERDALVVRIDAQTTQFGGSTGRRVRGRITIHPELLLGTEIVLDTSRAHRWWPLAPLARIEVELAEPEVRFSGHGYLDANAGDGPLEASFAAWNWARARSPDGAILTYDVDERDDGGRSLGMLVRPSGAIERVEHPRSLLPTTLWGIERRVCADRHAEPRVVRVLEDGPSYARSLVATRLGGHEVVAMHETLDATRLGRRWVRFLTGFRTGRAV